MSTQPHESRDDGAAGSCELLLVGARMATLEGDGYGLIEDGALASVDGRIAYVGARDALPARFAQAARTIDCSGLLLTPGLVDCHTHAVFAGHRAQEFELRLGGASYEEIARAGGGISSTLRATRGIDADALLAQSLPRVRALVDEGATTVEIKSGYGLDLASERMLLRVARAVGTDLGIDVRTTYLGAHALPPEFAGRADDYVSACIEWMRTLAAEGLIDAVDAFCETIGFSPAQTARVFDAASALSLPVKLHADQLSDSAGAALAARYHALSADHLEYLSAEGIEAMARAGTVAVLLPGAFLCLRETRVPPIEALRAAGVPIAVATDLNPGTSPLLSLRLAMGLACAQFGLTPLEALRGATREGARALGLRDVGTLASGQRTDCVLWQAGDPAELSYWLGGNLARLVVARGRVLRDRLRDAAALPGGHAPRS